MSWNPYEAVRKGAELLDERVPGWASKIVQDEFGMIDRDTCVLGQQVQGFGGFEKLTYDLFGSGDGHFGFNWGEIEAHGFAAPTLGVEEDVEAYAALDDAWQQQINKRAVDRKVR